MGPAGGMCMSNFGKRTEKVSFRDTETEEEIERQKERQKER